MAVVMTATMMGPPHREVGGAEAHVVGIEGGVTPLMYACQQGHDHHVRQILHRKPTVVKERDRTGKSAAHYCAENPTLNCIDQVVSADPSMINSRDEDGYTPLHLATIAGNKLVAKFVISRGADVSAIDNEKHTAIHWATVCGEVELLDLLMDAGADPSTPDIHGAYPLHYAAQMCGPNSELGNDVRVGLGVLRKLLQRGVDVSVVDHDGRQPLLWAASAGSADAILALVNAGSNVAAEDKDGLTALHCAASRGHLDCLDCLITLCGAEVDTLDSNGCTALFYAVTLGHADCTELLLNHGALPNRQDRKGRTPAHCGAAKGQLETLKLLHRHGADLWMRNVKGDLPLHEACQSGRKDLVNWLLMMRPDTVNAPNTSGRCPLHIAAINNNIEMCKILMDRQAHINPIMRNSRGQLLTPLDAAVARGNRGTAKYLQLHGGVLASKLTDKHALQKAMQRALEANRHDSTGATPSDVTPDPDELLSSSTSSVLKSSMSTMTVSPVNPEAQTDTSDLNPKERRPVLRDAQESGYSDTMLVDHDSDVEGPTDHERHTDEDGDDDDEDTVSSSKTRVRRKRRTKEKDPNAVGRGASTAHEERRDGDGAEEAEEEEDYTGDRQAGGERLLRRRRGERRRLGRKPTDSSTNGNGEGPEEDYDEEGNEEEDEEEDEDEESSERRGVHSEDESNSHNTEEGEGGGHRKAGMRRGRIKSGAMSGGPMKVETVDNSLKRKPKKVPQHATEMSITQAMQTTMRKYALERRLFQQLLELKRLQIRNTRANEHVLVKRMVDSYNKEGTLLGLRGYGGPFSFNGYEKYLYDQLRFLQSAQGTKIPHFRASDDVEKLSRALRRAEILELPDTFIGPRDPGACNHSTHRCHHATYAYTGIPCAAYLGKRNNNNKNNMDKKKAGDKLSLPRIAGTQQAGGSPGGTSSISPSGGGTGGGVAGGGVGVGVSGGGGSGTGTNANSPAAGNTALSPSGSSRPARSKSSEPLGLRNYDPNQPLTLELQHGRSRQQITLPTEVLDKSKKYHLTFSIKPSTPGSSAPPAPGGTASARSAPDPSLQKDVSPDLPKGLRSAPAEGRAVAEA